MLGGRYVRSEVEVEVFLILRNLTHGSTLEYHTIVFTTFRILNTNFIWPACLPWGRSSLEIGDFFKFNNMPSLSPLFLGHFTRWNLFLGLPFLHRLARQHSSPSSILMRKGELPEGEAYFACSASWTCLARCQGSRWVVFLSSICDGQCHLHLKSFSCPCSAFLFFPSCFFFFKKETAHNYSRIAIT